MPQPVAAPSDAPHLIDAPVVWIEIRRGRTQYPRRPIAADRFLIGAGSSCHLQLGGDNMPFLHSLIVRTEGDTTIEAFVPSPELRVNGAAVKSAMLGDGDTIAIGGIEFAVHLQPSLETEAEDPLHTPIPLNLADSAEEEVADLSAEELVVRLEAAEAEVEAYDAAQRAGAAALLEAVRSAAAPIAPAAAVDDDVEAELLSELSTFSIELEQRLTALRQQEDAQRIRAEALLSAQDKLAEQLRLATQSLAHEQARNRASA